MIRIFCLVFTIFGGFFFLDVGESGPLSDSKFELEDILDNPELDEHDYETLFIQENDDPANLALAAKAIWMSPSAQKNPLLKARAGWIILKCTDESVGPTLEIFNETLALIEQYSLNISKDEIMVWKMLSQISEGEKSLAEISDQLLKAANKIRPDSMKAMALSDIAFYYADRSYRTSEIPNLLNEISKILDYRHAPVTAINLRGIHTLAITLAYLKEVTESEYLKVKLEEYCELHQARSICGLILYEIGRTLSMKGDKANALLAVQKFHKALKMLEATQGNRGVANSYYGLLTAYNKMQNYKEAIKYGKMAYKSYSKTGPKDWTASILNHLSKAYIGNGEKEKGLQAAKSALAICPPEFKIDLVGINQQISVAYEALDNYKEALRYFKIYSMQDKLIRTDGVTQAYLEQGLKLEAERGIKLKEHLRLEEEKNSLLHSQNELQSRELLLTHRLRIVAIILLILLIISGIAMTLAIQRGRLVLRAKAKMQAILDNIDEGLMSIDSKLLIKDGHSACAQRLFPDSTLVGKDVFDVIFRNVDAPAEDLSVWRESLNACMGEDSITWELNGENFPRQIIISSPQNQILSLNWQPIIFHGVIQYFLLSVRDITSVRALEAEIVAERQRRDGLQNHIMEILSHDYYEARRLIHDIGEALPHIPFQSADSVSRADLVRNLHTNKGIARSLVPALRDSEGFRNRIPAAPFHA